MAILICGLPGSGKTWLAGLLVLRLEGAHLRTDRIRRELFPVRSYTAEETKAVYGELLRRAEQALGKGRSTVLDGTYLVTSRREEVYALFRRLEIPSIVVLATAAKRVVRARFARKPLLPDPNDFSEATFAVYREMTEALSSDPNYSLPTADRDVCVLVVETERGELIEPHPKPRLDGFYQAFADLDAAIFDMDGVLVHSEEAWIKSEREFLEEKGIYLGEEGWKEFQLRHAPYLAGRNQTEAARFYQEVFHLQEPVEEIRRQRMAIVRGYFAEAGLVPGVTELIAELRDGGLKLGLASASPPDLIELILKKYDLEKFFSAVVSGDETGEAKPNPEIYLRAARQLEIEPARCLVFEDAPNGVRAARAAGMRCAWLPNPALRFEGEIACEFVLESFEGLEFSRLRTSLACRQTR